MIISLLHFGCILMFQFFLISERYTENGKLVVNEITGLLAFDDKTMYLRIGDYPTAEFEVVHIEKQTILFKYSDYYGTLIITSSSVYFLLGKIKIEYGYKATTFPVERWR